MKQFADTPYTVNVILYYNQFYRARTQVNEEATRDLQKEVGRLTFEVGYYI